MNKQTFTMRYFFPFRFQENFLKLPFPRQSSKWVSVYISLKRNKGVFNIFSWFGPFVSWKTYPYFLPRYLQKCTNEIHHEKSVRSQETNQNARNQHVWSSFAWVCVWSLVLLINGSHGCDGYRKLVWPHVGHMHQFILWLIGQVCWLTTECLVCYFWPNTNILRQFVSILQIILQLIQALVSLSDDLPNQDLELCTVALSFYSPTHITFPRIFEHDLPYRMSTLQLSREVFPILVNFQLPQQKYVIQTFLCTSQQQFHLVCIHVE